MIVSPVAIKKLLRGYDLGEYTSHERFPQGFNTNIRVRTTKGAFLLKIYFHGDKSVLVSEVELLLILKCLSVPQPIEGENGYVSTIGRKLCVFFTLFPGTHANMLNARQLSELARAAARLHKLTRGYKNHVIKMEKNISFQLDYNYKRAPKKEKLFVKKLGEYAKEQYTLHPVSDSLPSATIHGDLWKSNLLYSKGKLCGIIDFGDAGYAPMVYELGDLLFYWCWNGLQFDYSKARAIVADYQSVRTLTDTEKKNLRNALIRRGLLISLYSIGWHIDHKSPVTKSKMMKKASRIIAMNEQQFLNKLF